MNTGWAVKWQLENRPDGKKQSLLGRFSAGTPDVPPHVEGYIIMVFRTKRQAQEYIKLEFGYIAKRPDLRRAPFKWRMPAPTRVEVIVRGCR